MKSFNFKDQRGNSTLFMALLLASVTGLGIKVASDRFGNQANTAADQKKYEEAENAIEAAVAKAQALLTPIAGTPRKPALLRAEPLEDNINGKPALRSYGSNPSWNLVNPKQLSVAVDGYNVNITFLKAIPKQKPLLPSEQMLVGYDVMASTTVTLKSGSVADVKRGKQLLMEPVATDGGQDSPTECELEGPGFAVEPNVSATATLKVKGQAILANVPRTSTELGTQVVARGEVLKFDGKNYSVKASDNLFLTRFTGGKGNRKNEFSIKLDDSKPVELGHWRSYEFEFDTPRPLTAVDGGIVNFPMWASIQLTDGSWKRCKQTVVQVRQVTSCEFSAPSSPEINLTDDKLELSDEEYPELAPLFAKKGYDVPGCKANCSVLSDAKTCGGNSHCFWYARAEDNIANCFYKDPAQLVKCDNVSGPKIPVLRKVDAKIPKSTNITWRTGMGGSACKEMDVEILPPAELVEGKKYKGPKPVIKGNPSCGNRTFSVEVDDRRVPNGLWRIKGTYKSAEGKGTCIASVKVGVDPCDFTNKKSAGKSLGFFINYFGSKGTHSQYIQPRAITESEYYAADPWNAVNCAENNARCYYTPGANRTLFVHINNPNLPTCSMVPVPRTNLGCFAYGSKIMMGDGSLVAGETVKKGDYVWNPVIKMPVKVTETTSGPERPALVKIETTSGEVIRVTRNHPVLTKMGLKAAKDILVGDEVQHMSGGLVKVSAVSSDKHQGSFVWNVRLEGPERDDSYHYVLVDGLVTGDLHLQEKLETAFKLSQQERK